MERIDNESGRVEATASDEAKSASCSTTQRTETPMMMCVLREIGLESESARVSAVTNGFRAPFVRWQPLLVMILNAEAQGNVLDVTQTLQEKVCVEMEARCWHEVTQVVVCCFFGMMRRGQTEFVRLHGGRKCTCHTEARMFCWF